MGKNLLMIFVKNPEMGKVKTRLAKTIGNNSALLVYKHLLQYTKNTVLELDLDCSIFYSNFIDPYDLWDNDKFRKYKQEEGDLGFRMQSAFAGAFEGNYEKVVIIGSDCYELDADTIRDAFKQLDNNDCVVGPANDGGYYLLGMRQFVPELFEDVAWSTDAVYPSTIAECEKQKLSVVSLKEMTDIDEFCDIEKFDDLVDLVANEIDYLRTQEGWVPCPQAKVS